MSKFTSLGLGRGFLSASAAPRVEHVAARRQLGRILAFTGRSIDDVVNNPLAKRHVYGYYKLHRWMHREAEIAELERAWNPLGRRT
jgi:hypothetical protein